MFGHMNNEQLEYLNQKYNFIFILTIKFSTFLRNKKKYVTIWES